MKIVTIVGARPQFVKTSAMSRAIREWNQQSDRKQIEEIIIHTGQHYDANMSDLFFRELEIASPQYHLGIGGLSHGAMTGRMIEGIESILCAEKPAAVLVYGDTNSTLAGALAAVKLHIPVAHVEAGLRSFNRTMPEELNRLLTDHSSDLLFAPTTTACQNLRNEGIDEQKIRFVGDVMLDVSLYYRSNMKSQILEKLHLKPKEYVLATIHRAENTEQMEKLREVFLAFQQISTQKHVVVPLHPRTKARLEQEKEWPSLQQGLHIIDPTGYLDMICLESQACAILTDSGGVQKEAFFFQVPCLTLREETEWVELVEKGYNRIVGTKKAAIVAGLEQALQSRPDWKHNLYGEGQAAQKIIETLAERYL